MPQRPPYAPVLAATFVLCAGSLRLQAPPDPLPLKPPPEKWAAGFRSITPEQCREWLTVIASDEMGGRATTTEGFEKAARYVADRFKEFGLKPIGDDGTYFQKVPFGEVVADPKESFIAVQDAGGTEKVRIAFGAGFGGSAGQAADRVYDLVLVRASTQADLEGFESDGKAVLLLDRGTRGMRVNVTRPRGRPADAVAGLVLRIDDRQAATRTGRPTYIGPQRARGLLDATVRLNSYSVTREAAGKLLAAAGVDAKELEAEGAGVVPCNAKLVVKVKPTTKTIDNPMTAVNVVGLLEGADSVLKDEVVGIGSHLDHIGTSAQTGQVNNGADDDGSGTTGVLAVARAMTLNPAKPRRSVLFMCFCAEELGLQGSLYYTMKPIIENSRMVAELQMDMIGRNEEKANEKASANLNTLHLVGTKKLSDELHEICMATNRDHVGFDFEFDEESVFSRSDHKNFAEVDIPIAFFFTGFHPQYHRHDDEVGLIDFPKLSRVAKLAYLIGCDAADRETRIKVDRKYAEIPAEERGGFRLPGSRRATRPADAAASRPASAPATQPAR